MSYRTMRGFLAVALMLTALNLCVRAQGTTPAAESRSVIAATTSADSDRARDGLSGPVRRVRTEIIKLSTKGAKVSEGQRALLETASYDIKGNKSENAYYPVAGETLTGREVYKYDDRGNISEMTLHGSDGSLISKETYTYEFDLVGNWVKMTASVAVIEGGKLSFEPTETTYRTIAYYLDENMARTLQTGSTIAAIAPSSTSAEAHATAKTEPVNASTATGVNNKTGAGRSAQTVALPAANGLDKTNMISIANRGGEMPGGANNARANSPVVKIDAAGEPPSSMPTPKPLTKPVSGGVLNGAAIDLPKPEYPEIARRARAGGTVSIEVVIDETGKVVSARASSGNALLREAALKAALRARFSPTKLSGQPVKIAGLLNYNFNID